MDDAYERITGSLWMVTLTFDVADGVATVELDWPEKLNALDTDVVLDLQRAFSEFSLDGCVDAVVVTGASDDAFSAGADIEGGVGPAADHDP